MAITTNNLIRYTLATLLFIVALNAFGGGWYGMAGADQVPAEWLEGSPFNSYFIPVLVLFTVIGGSSLTAALLSYINHRLQIKAAYVAGTIMLLWIGAQVIIIGYVSWLQPAVAIAGAATIVLSYYLQRAPQK